MKKALLVLTVVVVALSFSQAASALTINLQFDGYCDGMSLNIISGTGLVDGAQIGCEDAPIHGTVGRVTAQGTAVTITLDPPSPYAGTIFVIRQNGTWSIYRNDGSGIYEFNSGTWSNVFAVEANGSTARSTD